MDTYLPIGVANTSPAGRTTGKTADSADVAAGSLFAGLLAGLFALPPASGAVDSGKQDLTEGPASQLQSAADSPSAAGSDRGGDEDGGEAPSAATKDSAVQVAALMSASAPVPQVAESATAEATLTSGGVSQPASAASACMDTGTAAVTGGTAESGHGPAAAPGRGEAGTDAPLTDAEEKTASLASSGGQSSEEVASPATQPAAQAVKAAPAMSGSTPAFTEPASAGTGSARKETAALKIPAPRAAAHQTRPNAAGSFASSIPEEAPGARPTGGDTANVSPESPSIKDAVPAKQTDAAKTANIPAPPAEPPAEAMPDAGREALQKSVSAAVRNTFVSGDMASAVRKPEARDDKAGPERAEGAAPDGRYGAVDTALKADSAQHLVKAAEPPRTITVRDQVFQVTKLSETKLEVTVHPEGLGKLDIEVNLSSGQIHARISAADVQVKQMLERNLPDILNSLSAEGYSVGGFSVGLRDGRENMQQQPDEKRTAGVKQVAAESMPVRPLTNNTVNTVSIFV